jgi:periplasmic divalent cation tolerance protein
MAFSVKIKSMKSLSSDTEEIVVFVTTPDEGVAVRIAKSLVEARLAACVNIIKDIRSIYSWQGKIEDDSEVLLVVKTRNEHFDSLSKKIKELHSYSVPEIIALPIIKGSEDYLKWIREVTL